MRGWSKEKLNTYAKEDKENKNEKEKRKRKKGRREGRIKERNLNEAVAKDTKVNKISDSETPYSHPPTLSLRALKNKAGQEERTAHCPREQPAGSGLWPPLKQPHNLDAIFISCRETQPCSSEVDKPSLVKLIVGGGLTWEMKSQGLVSRRHIVRQGHFRLTSLFFLFSTKEFWDCCENVLLFFRVRVTTIQ